MSYKLWLTQCHENIIQVVQLILMLVLYYILSALDGGKGPIILETTVTFVGLASMISVDLIVLGSRYYAIRHNFVPFLIHESFDPLEAGTRPSSRQCINLLLSLRSL